MRKAILEVIGVLIVEPDSILCARRIHQLSAAGEVDVLGFGRNLTEACSTNVAASRVDVVVTNMDGWQSHWVESWAHLHGLLPGARVVGLIGNNEDRAVLWALVAGVIGLHRANVESATLQTTVIGAAQGIANWDPTLADRAKTLLFDYLSARHAAGGARSVFMPPAGLCPETHLPDLTAGEKRVLALLGQGLSNRRIAKDLFLSERTIRNRVSSILRKLQVDNRTQAALAAIELGFADLPHAIQDTD